MDIIVTDSQFYELFPEYNMQAAYHTSFPRTISVRKSSEQRLLDFVMHSKVITCFQNKHFEEAVCVDLRRRADCISVSSALNQVMLNPGTKIFQLIMKNGTQSITEVDLH